MLLDQQRWMMLFVQQCRMVLDHQFWTNLLNLFKRPLKLYDFRLAIHFFFQETNLMVYSSTFPKLV